MTLEIAGKRVTVMGLGHFGGGSGVTRWLAEQQGCEVLVTDQAPAEKLADSVAGVRDLVDKGMVRLRLGEHNVSDFTDTDVVVANPAVSRPWENRFLRAAEAAGVPITTEIRLLIERLPERRRIIGITGSAGKSTTTSMCHHVLKELVKGGGAAVHLGGNLGGSLLGQYVGPQDWVVLELSSAMLYWLSEGVGYRGAQGFSPHVAVVTNIEANHLDWHGEFAHYARSKQQILRDQRAWDFAILGKGAATWEINHHVALCHVPPPPQCDPGVRLMIPGAHNRVNAWVALAAAAFATGQPQAELAPALASFAGLPHRLQLTATGPEGRRFFNDSKATTPEATRLAVGAFEEEGEVGAGKVHLIVGGYDKKIDLKPVAELAGRLAGMYTIGTVGPTIARLAREAGAGAKVAECDTLERAVAAALGRMGSGEVLLLSPACASWDQYVNFERRGEEFARLVLGRLNPDGARPLQGARR